LFWSNGGGESGVYGRLLPCLEREEESVSTEFAEEDMGLEGHGSEKLAGVVNGRPTKICGPLTLTKRQGAREGTVDFGARYL
jgi:hypothetical protein